AAAWYTSTDSTSRPRVTPPCGTSRRPTSSPAATDAPSLRSLSRYGRYTPTTRQKWGGGSPHSAYARRPMAEHSTTDGLRLAVEIEGPDDAPTVVLVHGLAGSIALAWRATGVLDRLSAAGLRSVAFDLRGH